MADQSSQSESCSNDPGPRLLVADGYAASGSGQPLVPSLDQSGRPMTSATQGTRSNSVDPEPKKKLRISRACVPCRQRRKKCDGGNPCGPCAAAPRSCEYTPAKRRGPVPKSLQRAAGPVAPSPSARNHAPEASQGLPSLDVRLDPRGHLHLSSRLVDCPWSWRLQELSLLGLSSVADSAHPLDSGSIWVPPQDVLDALVMFFLDELHVLVPFVSREDVGPLLAVTKTPFAPDFFAQALLAFAAHFFERRHHVQPHASDDPPLSALMLSQAQGNLGAALEPIAKTSMPTFGSAVRHVHALLLLALIDDETLASPSYVLSGQAVREAMRLGLHLASSPPATDAAAAPTWAYCVCLDVMAALVANRSPTVPEDLLPVDFGHAPDSVYLAAIHRLFSLAARIAWASATRRTNVALPPKLQQLERDLNGALLTFPPSLAYNAMNPMGNHMVAVHLRIMYLAVALHLHRAALLYCPIDANRDNLVSALNYAFVELVKMVAAHIHALPGTPISLTWIFSLILDASHIITVSTYGGAQAITPLLSHLVNAMDPMRTRMPQLHLFACGIQELLGEIAGTPPNTQADREAIASYLYKVRKMNHTLATWRTHGELKLREMADQITSHWLKTTSSIRDAQKNKKQFHGYASISSNAARINQAMHAPLSLTGSTGHPIPFTGQSSLRDGYSSSATGNAGIAESGYGWYSAPVNAVYSSNPVASSSARAPFPPRSSGPEHQFYDDFQSTCTSSAYSHPPPGHPQLGSASTDQIILPDSSYLASNSAMIPSSQQHQHYPATAYSYMYAQSPTRPFMQGHQSLASSGAGRLGLDAHLTAPIQQQQPQHGLHTHISNQGPGLMFPQYTSPTIAPAIDTGNNSSWTAIPACGSAPSTSDGQHHLTQSGSAAAFTPNQIE